MRRCKSPLKEISPVSPKQTQLKINKNVGSSNTHHGQSNINRHLRDFLHFEDGDNLNSPDNEFAYADQKLMQTSTMPKNGVTRVIKDNALGLSDERKKIAHVVSID
jgi:hypothetical protein